MHKCINNYCKQLFFTMNLKMIIFTCIFKKNSNYIGNY